MSCSVNICQNYVTTCHGVHSEPKDCIKLLYWSSELVKPKMACWISYWLRLVYSYHLYISKLVGHKSIKLLLPKQFIYRGSNLQFAITSTLWAKKIVQQKGNTFFLLSCVVQLTRRHPLTKRWEDWATYDFITAILLCHGHEIAIKKAQKSQEPQRFLCLINVWYDILAQ